MGFITPDKKGGEEEEPGPGRSLDLDLDVLVCPECRRELLPWQDECPEDGAAGVTRSELPPAEDIPVPEHLLDELDDDEADDEGIVPG